MTRMESSPPELIFIRIFPQVSVEIRETSNGVESPFLKLIVTRIGANMKARTFDLDVEAYLGGIFLQHLQYKSK